MSEQLWRDRQFLPQAKKLMFALRVRRSEEEVVSHVYQLFCAFCWLPGKLSALGILVCHSGQRQLSSYRKLGEHSQKTPVLGFLCGWPEWGSLDHKETAGRRCVPPEKELRLSCLPSDARTEVVL